MKSREEIIQEQFKLARDLNDSRVDRLLAFNNDEDYLKSVVCYGFAIGADAYEIVASDEKIYFGLPSQPFRTKEFEDQIPGDRLTHYRVIADGLIPLSSMEARLADESRHIVYGFGDHILRRVGKVWMHKGGDGPITLSYGSQPIITDILMAGSEHNDGNLAVGIPGNSWGFFEVTENRAKMGAKNPPDYDKRTVERLASFFYSIGNFHEWRWRPHGHDRFMEEMDKFDQFIVNEITALGLRDHPKMERTMRQITTGIWRQTRQLHYSR